MIKPSKYLLTFIGIFSFLSLVVFFSSQKFLPVLFQHTVYFCQSILQSISLRVPESLGIIIAGIIGLLVAVVVLKLLIAYIKVVYTRMKLRSQVQNNSVFLRVIKRIGLDQKALLVNSDKPFAFCHGVRQPKIYISTALFGLMTELELEAVLIHENYHVEHKDSLIMLLAEIARSLFPFFPLLSDLLHNYRIERELAADHEAIRYVGNSTSLISVLKKLLSIGPVEQYAFAPALGDHETLEVRIRALTKKEFHFARFGLFNVLISIFSLGILGAIVVAPVQAVETHNPGNDVMMVCLQNDSCAAWCKENKTVVPSLMTPAFSSPVR